MDQDHTSCDVQPAELRARFPGWRVWVTPRATVPGAWWSAQPARYPLVSGDPDELAEAIEADPCVGEPRPNHG